MATILHPPEGVRVTTEYGLLIILGQRGGWGEREALLGAGAGEVILVGANLASRLTEAGVLGLTAVGNRLEATSGVAS